MSSEETELKGGHPAAVKVGGMRVTQHKAPQEKPEPPKPKSDSDDEEEQAVKPASPPKPQIMISGVLAKGNADFPTQAVQATQTKPLPTLEYRSKPANKPTVIQQPRK